MSAQSVWPTHEDWPTHEECTVGMFVSLWPSIAQVVMAVRADPKTPPVRVCSLHHSGPDSDISIKS